MIADELRRRRQQYLGDPYSVSGEGDYGPLEMAR
jgi:hypothetical protein